MAEYNLSNNIVVDEEGVNGYVKVPFTRDVNDYSGVMFYDLPPFRKAAKVAVNAMKAENNENIEKHNEILETNVKKDQFCCISCGEKKIDEERRQTSNVCEECEVKNAVTCCCLCGEKKVQQDNGSGFGLFRQTHCADCDAKWVMEDGIFYRKAKKQKLN